MTELHELQCEACKMGAQKISDDETHTLLQKIPEWEIITQGDIKQLERVFSFKNFKMAWVFTDKVAALAEEAFHHPEITLEWGKVTVRWWSHAVQGLHKNDFICAAKTDQLQ
ncbi:4a-hydroxytetrahydrobiopterin dehydratase [Photobacterium nomapromontoriensis]|uniref:4a-hydroxytetrahydrobiopterin dehydratase n=1 Tax=Photobacterium nomapromontoriensis TaxID=2910237 RepID=UPI003D142961